MSRNDVSVKRLLHNTIVATAGRDSQEAEEICAITQQKLNE